MLKYEKPVVESTEDVAESVYMASGDVKTGVCPYGREFANAGADICQICSKTVWRTVTDRSDRNWRHIHGGSKRKTGTTGIRPGYRNQKYRRYGGILKRRKVPCACTAFQRA